MKLALTSIAIVAIVLLCAAAIVQLEVHGHPVAPRPTLS
jgi:hypothetical protein